MIPAITPPTDNLYKFIALFGLTIFLFSMYNLEIVFENSTKNKVQIEQIKVDLQKELHEHSKVKHQTLSPDSTNDRFRPAKIKWLDMDLRAIERAINTSTLTFVQKTEFRGSLSQLNAQLDTLKLRQNIYFVFVGVGIIVMLLGFLFWKKKEQDLRDKILYIEHTIKQLEHENKAKKKKKKRQLAQTLETTAIAAEKLHVSGQMDQN